MPNFGLLLPAVLNGVTMGAVYALIALGLTLIYGVLHIINFAHGSLLMLALYAAFFLYALGGVDPTRACGARAQSHRLHLQLSRAPARARVPARAHPRDRVPLGDAQASACAATRTRTLATIADRMLGVADHEPRWIAL